MNPKAPTGERWRWPSTGIDPDQLAQAVLGVPSLYETETPPICYPGTPLNPNLVTLASGILSKQLNAIGTHTHLQDDGAGGWEKTPGEGGFDGLQTMESEAIWMTASILGGTPQTIDGNFCPGGTEANLQGMWLGREWLRKHMATGDQIGVDKKVVVFTTSLVHYSVIKAAEILGLGYHKWQNCSDCGVNHIFKGPEDGSGVNFVPMNSKGEMDPEALESAILEKYRQGFRRFMMVPTAGTTALGSVDPINLISQAMDHVRSRHSDALMYMHVDASFGGFTIPFLNPEHGMGFDTNSPNLMSMALDADKMGHMPYPAGIFLCRKNLQSYIARDVHYVRGHQDDTVSGSRSALAPMLAWYYYQTIGIDGHTEYVQKCIDLREELALMISARFPQEQVDFFPCSPWTNFLPLEIKLKNGKIPEDLIEHGHLSPYHLRDDCFPSNPHDVSSCPRSVYKICIMPHHTLSHLERFVSDLATTFAEHG